MFYFRYIILWGLMGGMLFGLGGCAKSNPVFPVAPEPQVISGALDDFEEGSSQNKLGGQWFVYADASGTRISPTPNTYTAIAMYPFGSPATPRFSFRFSGVLAPADPGRVIFAGFGCTLNSSGASVDLSRYRGIEFYARSGVGTRVTFLLKKHALTAANSDFQIVVPLTPDWKKIRIDFSELKQPATAFPISFSSRDIDSLQWLPAAGETQFDFQIDDVNFYGYN
jgi:hypothetical protein